MPSQTDIDFGQIAVQNKLITKKQLDEAIEALEKLEKQLKGKKGKPKPRLVDVLVQKKFLDGAQAMSVEKARNYRQRRIEDKLYARIALKSKFVKQKTIEKGLEAQKKNYMGGKDPVRLSEWLLEFDSTPAQKTLDTLLAINSDYPAALAKVKKAMDYVHERQAATMQVMKKVIGA